MNRRISHWLGVGVLAAGLSAGMIGLAATATAQPGSASSTNGATSSAPAGETSSATGTGADTATDRAGHKPRHPGHHDKTKPAAGTDSASHQPNTPEPQSSGSTPARTAAKHPESNDPARVSANTEQPKTPTVVSRAAANASKASLPVATAATTHEVQTLSALSTRSAAAPATPTTPTGPTLINVIGTLVFGLFDMTTKLIQGAPSVPAGSTVTVGRSTLQIPCATGYTAQADWYFPTGAQPPTRLIYFQHGILATDAYYNETAADLAENNDAIVVAPTITSNPFACDGCQIAGDQMHAAVAQLFLDPDRSALLASAQAAGFQGSALPEDFVLSGHSEGGQLAAGAAGYFEALAPDDQTRHELVGVLMFDTADDNGVLPSSDGVLTRALATIPDDIPVLNIAAKPNFFDAYGDANAALEAARPGQFNGVQLVGGAHSDAFRTTNPLIQFVVSIGTGFSAPQNVDAVQALAQGWINDMYAGTVDNPALRTGIYGDPGATIDIPTDAGTAQAYVLPAPASPPDAIYPFYLILRTLLLAANLNFATCAVPPANSPAGALDSAQAATPSCAAESRSTRV